MNFDEHDGGGGDSLQLIPNFHFSTHLLEMNFHFADRDSMQLIWGRIPIHGRLAVDLMCR